MIKNKSKNKKRIIPEFKSKNIIWLFVAAFVSLQVFYTIQTATVGAQLANLELEEKELLKSNQDLSSNLVRSSSLSELEQTADELGFNKPLKTFYVSTDEFVAQLP